MSSRPRHLVGRHARAWWIPVVVIAAISMPTMLTTRTFGTDWTLHLWLVRQQQLNLEAMSHPGLFVSVSRLGVFYPIFAFVGSGLYTVGGGLAIALGDRPILAYRLLYLIGLCIAYGGMTWLSTQLGLRGWRSQMPGLVLVTGAYYVTDLVGRGDLGEFMAVSAMPLLLAAGRSVFASSRVRARDLLATLIAVFLVTGSNNITFLWGAIFVVLLLVVSLVAFAPVGLPAFPWPRAAAVAGSGLIGLGLNAWFLVPDLRYGLDTLIAKLDAKQTPSTTLAGFGVLMNPFRSTDLSNSPFHRDFRVALPWLFAAWAVAVVAILWHNRPAASRRAFAGVVASALLYVVLIAWHGVWKFLPHVLYNLQFSVRLLLWVIIATAMLVMLALTWQARADRRTKRATTIALVLIVVFNLGTATWQVWRAHSQYIFHSHAVVSGHRLADQVVASRYDAPVSWSRGGDFRDVSAALVATSPARTLEISPRAVHASRFAAVVAVPNGPQPFSTNIAAGPRFVAMTGIRPVGRTHDGLVVAVRAATVAPTGPIMVTIRPIESKALKAGVFVSIVSLVLLSAMLLWGLARFVGDRRLRASPR